VVSIGSDGQGVLMHSHDKAWFVQLHGEKSWVLLPPATAFAAPRFADRAAVRDVFFRPTRNWPPHIRDAVSAVPGILHCSLRPGEMLLVPPMWWHATENHGESFGIGGRRMGTGFPTPPTDLLVRAALAPLPALEFLAPTPPERKALADLLGDLALEPVNVDDATSSGSSDHNGDHLVAQRAAAVVANATLSAVPVMLPLQAKMVQWQAQLGEVESALSTLTTALGDLDALRSLDLLSGEDHAFLAVQLCWTFHAYAGAGAVVDLVRAAGAGTALQVPAFLFALYQAGIEYLPPQAVHARVMELLRAGADEVQRSEFYSA
jgi:hypothetical protein